MNSFTKCRVNIVDRLLAKEASWIPMKRAKILPVVSRFLTYNCWRIGNRWHGKNLGVCDDSRTVEVLRNRIVQRNLLSEGKTRNSTMFFPVFHGSILKLFFVVVEFCSVLPKQSTKWVVPMLRKSLQQTFPLCFPFNKRTALWLK